MPLLIISLYIEHTTVCAYMYFKLALSGLSSCPHTWSYLLKNSNSIICTTGGYLSITGTPTVKDNSKKKKKEKKMEDPGIDPGTSRMLSERSTI